MVLLAATSGLVCGGGQLLGQRCFASLEDTKADPGFFAHQLVALPLMIVLAVLGTLAWVGPRPATVIERVLIPSDDANVICEIVVGALVFWDIPCALLIPSMKDPIMLAHHVGMAVVA